MKSAKSAVNAGNDNMNSKTNNNVSTVAMVVW